MISEADILSTPTEEYSDTSAAESVVMMQGDIESVPLSPLKGRKRMGSRDKNFLST